MVYIHLTMKKLHLTRISFWGLLVFPFFSIGQAAKQNVDSLVLSWNLIHYHDADLLADTLTSSFNNDSEKVRAIFFWVTQYVSYDWNKFHQDQNITMETSHMFNKDGDFDVDKEIKHTLISKKGVCQDYAELFSYLCNSVKIKCEVVSGYGSTGCADWLLALDARKSNHAWNAVMINNKWYLLDATWASGTGSTRVKRSRNDFYYLTPPKDFIKDHFPDEEQWELLESPIDLKAFVAMAKSKKQTEN